VRPPATAACRRRRLATARPSPGRRPHQDDRPEGGIDRAPLQEASRDPVGGGPRRDPPGEGGEGDHRQPGGGRGEARPDVDRSRPAGHEVGVRKRVAGAGAGVGRAGTRCRGAQHRLPVGVGAIRTTIGGLGGSVEGGRRLAPGREPGRRRAIGHAWPSRPCRPPRRAPGCASAPSAGWVSPSAGASCRDHRARGARPTGPGRGPPAGRDLTLVPAGSWGAGGGTAPGPSPPRRPRGPADRPGWDAGGAARTAPPGWSCLRTLRRGRGRCRGRGGCA